MHLRLGVGMGHAEGVIAERVHPREGVHENDEQERDAYGQRTHDVRAGDGAAHLARAGRVSSAVPASKTITYANTITGKRSRSRE